MGNAPGRSHPGGRRYGIVRRRAIQRRNSTRALKPEHRAPGSVPVPAGIEPLLIRNHEGKGYATEIIVAGTVASLAYP
ncbi:MAG: hypothetical protein KJO08_09180, partial [Gammaproteobacteria bacterium]|nr:hypothetical protein [Gammaproteobacteria bacterium]